jgi:uncharacterized membrane protein (Fun14 family)
MRKSNYLLLIILTGINILSLAWLGIITINKNHQIIIILNLITYLFLLTQIKVSYNDI